MRERRGHTINSGEGCRVSFHSRTLLLANKVDRAVAWARMKERREGITKRTDWGCCGGAVVQQIFRLGVGRRGGEVVVDGYVPGEEFIDLEVATQRNRGQLALATPRANGRMALRKPYCNSRPSHYVRQKGSLQSRRASSRAYSIGTAAFTTINFGLPSLPCSVCRTPRSCGTFPRNTGGGHVRLQLRWRREAATGSLARRCERRRQRTSPSR